MRLKSIISATLIGSISLFTPVYAEYSIPAITTAEVNIRQYPSINAPVINTLLKGTHVDALESADPAWNRINFGSYDGYVYNAYLTAPAAASYSSNTYTFEQPTQKTSYPTSLSLINFKQAGVIDWGGWTWTYYTMSMFPGSTSTPVESRWVNSEGLVCDSEGYVILGSADLAPYTVVETPFGYMGKVYDTGCPHGVLDIYTDW